ncbi:MAG: alpha/beta fold hydrolase [Alphaproteobacteria bacterium]|nr:alpha/beta fold hydrolase [Alphaproteobacteria bacterium]
MQRWRLLILGLILVFGGAWLAHRIETSGGVTLSEVRYPGRSGETLAGLLYVPASASRAHPAPAVLVSHGYINTREMQSPFAIELARRGFVVLAIDMAGHGFSGGSLNTDDGGGAEGLAFLRALPFVDPNEIGLEGHSMGGVPLNAAARAWPDGYRAMVLEGSTTPEPGQVGAGSATFPRNLEVVFGRYDEFAPLMWRTAEGRLVGASPKLEALFGVRGPVDPDRTYGDIAAGTGRRLVIPPVTHPMEHFSKAGVGAAIAWLQMTLHGEAHPLPPSDQIWPWKEVGTAISLIGFGVLVLGAFDLLQPRIAAPAAPFRPIGWGWVAGFILAAAIPALTYMPLMNLGFAFFPSRLFPQWVTNQVAVWALGSALAGLLAGLVLRRPGSPWRLAGAGAAVGALIVGYLALAAVDGAFKTDFRLWVVGLKPLETAAHARDFVAYLGLFLAAFLLIARGLAGGVVAPLRGAGAQYLAGVLAAAGGFAVLLAIQYGALLTTGRLPDPKEALNAIIAIQFLPILAFVGVVVVFTWRRTGSHVAGGLLCAGIITWYIVAGTATHWRPGWSVPKMDGLFPDRPAASAPKA